MKVRPECIHPDSLAVSALLEQARQVRGLPLNPQSDHKAQAGLRSVSNAALDAIAHRYRGALIAYFRRRVTPVHESEDLTQEVLLRLAQRAGGGDIRAVQPYVFQTAANVLTDHLRRRAARGWGLTEQYRDEIHARATVSPEDTLIDDELRTCLTAAIESLPERARHAFVLFRFEGMRQSDIAAHMGISLSAVEKHIRLGMVRLACALAPTE